MFKAQTVFSLFLFITNSFALYVLSSATHIHGPTFFCLPSFPFPISSSQYGPTSSLSFVVLSFVAIRTARSAYAQSKPAKILFTSQRRTVEKMR